MTDLLQRIEAAGPGEQALLIAREAIKGTLTPDRHRRCNCRAEIDAGEWDNGHKIRACLEALAIASAILCAGDGE